MAKRGEYSHPAQNRLFPIQANRQSTPPRIVICHLTVAAIMALCDIVFFPKPTISRQ
jgi:hypothetical protein